MANTGALVTQKALGRALSGMDAHVGVLNAIAGLDWRVAGKRPEGFPLIPRQHGKVRCLRKITKLFR